MNKLREQFEKECGWWPSEINDRMDFRYIDEYREWLEKRIESTQTQNSDWISTDEQLPENDISVIVHGFVILGGEKDLLGHEKTFVCEAKHYDDGCFVKGINIHIHAIHWKPLPKKPNGYT